MTTTSTPPHIIDALAGLDDGHMTVDPDSPHAPDWTPPPARRQPGAAVEFFLNGSTEVLTTRIMNRDRIAYERAAMRHKEWPTGQSFVMTFLIWSAARRDGLTPASTTFDAFCEQVDDFDLVEEPADPTR